MTGLGIGLKKGRTVSPAREAVKATSRLAAPRSNEIARLRVATGVTQRIVMPTDNAIATGAPALVREQTDFHCWSLSAAPTYSVIQQPGVGESRGRTHARVVVDA